MGKMNIPQGINLYGNVIERGGFERLAAFPSTNNFAGRIVQLTTDGLFYKRNEANTGWDGLGSGFIKPDGSVAFTANQSMGGFKLTNLQNGSSDQDAATYKQVNEVLYQVDGVDTTSGRTASTLTAGGTVDTNLTLTAGQKILLANNTTEYGVYLIAASGAPTNLGQPKICYTYNGVGNQAKYYILDVSGTKYSELFVPLTRLFEKTTPVSGDSFELYDSANSSYKKKITWGSFQTFLNGIYQTVAGKNAASGYAGLSATFQLQLRNIANTFTSLLQNTNTAARTYTLQDRNGTLADDTDITSAKARANHTGTQLAATISDFNTAVDARVALGTAGLYDDRGNYDASVGTFPTTGGSGTAGAILKGDVFLVSVAGTLGGVAYSIGDSFRALVDTPGQTAGNWASMKQGSTISNAVIDSSPVQIGNGSLSVIGVTHNLNTKNIKAIVRKVSNDEIWTLEPAPTSVNACNLDFGAVVPSTNEFEVVIIGG